MRRILAYLRETSPGPAVASAPIMRWCHMDYLVPLTMEEKLRQGEYRNVCNELMDLVYFYLELNPGTRQNVIEFMEKGLSLLYRKDCDILIIDLERYGVICMFITGYHGTTQESADKIMKDGEFILSSSDQDWLGPGIYFYPSIQSAYDWRSAEAIVHAVIKIDSTEYLDLDTGKGKTLLRKVINYICETQHLPEFLSTPQKNQCAVMKMLWECHPQIKVMIASFSPERTRIKMLSDPRPRRREFCVRNNSVIKYTQCIRRSDLDG